MRLRQGSVQAVKRGQTAVPKTKELPAHLHAVRKARCDVSGFLNFALVVEMIYDLAQTSPKEIEL